MKSILLEQSYLVIDILLAGPSPERPKAKPALPRQRPKPKGAFWRSDNAVGVAATLKKVFTAYSDLRDCSKQFLQVFRNFKKEKHRKWSAFIVWFAP